MGVLDDPADYRNQASFLIRRTRIQYESISGSRSLSFASQSLVHVWFQRDVRLCQSRSFMTQPITLSTQTIFVSLLLFRIVLFSTLPYPLLLGIQCWDCFLSRSSSFFIATFRAAATTKHPPRGLLMQMRDVSPGAIHSWKWRRVVSEGRPPGHASCIADNLAVSASLRAICVAPSRSRNICSALSQENQMKALKSIVAHAPLPSRILTLGSLRCCLAAPTA